MASRRYIGKSFLNKNTGRTPAATLIRRVGRRPAPLTVIQQVHRRASIGTTWVLAVCPALLLGGLSLPQDETILYTVSILCHVHLWSRNLMTVVSSVVSWRLPSLPASGISVLGPLLLLLHHDVFQRMATPPANALTSVLPEFRLSTFLAAIFSTSLADVLKTIPRSTILMPHNKGFERLGMLVSDHLICGKVGLGAHCYAPRNRWHLLLQVSSQRLQKIHSDRRWFRRPASQW